MADDSMGPEPQLAKVPIGAIMVGPRTRRDMGDLEALAESIAAVGLLHPIVVTPALDLICGARRLRACRDILGLTEIHALTVDLDGDQQIIAERDENGTHKQFTFTERVEIGKAVEAALGERRGRPSEKVPKSAHLSGEKTREIAARRAGFGGSSRYEQAKKVIALGIQELVEAVEDGRLSINAAAEIAEESPDEQKKILSKGDAEVLFRAREVKTRRASERLERRRAQAADAAARLPSAVLDGHAWRLIYGDMRDVMAEMEPASIDAIITDPPYPGEFIDCFSWLSENAARVLKPSAPCIVMCGQSFLEDVLHRLSERLIYQWTLAYLTRGQSVQVFGRHIKCGWKPVVWLTNGPNDWEHVHDWVDESDRNDKRFHHWGQSVAGMAALVERFTVEQQVVLDPFCGAATTGAAAVALNRRFIGIDLDAAHVATAAERLGGRLADAA